MLKSKIIRCLLNLSILIPHLNIANIYSINNQSQELKDELLKKISAGIPEWMTNQIDQDFADVPKSGITLEMIEQTMGDEPEFRVKFIIKDGKVHVHSGTYSENSYKVLYNVLNELSSYIKLPDTIFLYNADDAPYNYKNLESNTIPPKSLAKYLVPVFAPTKHIDDKNLVVIPDQQTFEHMQDLIKEVKLGNSKYPSATKSPKAFWRGSTTGGFYFPENYTMFPRTKLLEISKQYPEILDAKFHNVVDYWGSANSLNSLFHALEYLSNSISVSEHMQYKYQILIDGHSASWSRCYWQLHSNSVILKQNSNYIQWYYGLLKPYVHYIPFDYYCSDLIEKIQWAEEHDDDVKQIIKNANAIAEDCLKYSDMLLYLYAVITTYAKLQAFKL